jgi:hypothetical protein
MRVEGIEERDIKKVRRASTPPPGAYASPDDRISEDIFMTSR